MKLQTTANERSRSLCVLSPIYRVPLSNQIDQSASLAEVSDLSNKSDRRRSWSRLLTTDRIPRSRIFGLMPEDSSCSKQVSLLPEMFQD